ncbi:hypothetical protein AURDEDRAFT_100103 [Auricularia subglabra TFB-10046 SS5]|nr:hypothetical protein AURDEDRAFT_100103 [Auricularia subglabra TFB-10046 SS5]
MTMININIGGRQASRHSELPAIAPSLSQIATAISSPSDSSPAHKDPLAFLRPLNKRVLTIILVGETGVGKTSFFSLLSNVCAGKTLQEFAPAHNPANDTGLCETLSQTRDAMVYEFERYDGVRIRVLDTPGLCDTRGVEQDIAHKASIAHAIRDNVAQVDAVIVMANGTNKRLTVPTDYALNTLSTMFPASIATNICFLFTMVDNPLAFNFHTTSLPTSLHSAELFTIQNPLALHLRFQELLQRTPAPTEAQRKRWTRLLHAAYDATVETLDDLFVWLDSTQPSPTTEISQLYEMTIGIESTIADVIARLRQMEDQRGQIARLRADLESSKQTMKVNEQFETIMHRNMHVQKDTPGRHSTLCILADCYSNCHVPCNLPFLRDPEKIGQGCTAFNGDRDGSHGKQSLQLICDKCGHLAKDHRHFHALWVEETREERVVDESARKSYRLAKKDAGNYAAQMERMQDSLQELDSEIDASQKLLDELCEQFQQLALTGNFVGNFLATIRMLEFRRESKASSGDVDGVNALTRTIESFEVKVRVLRDLEVKKEQWMLASIAQGQVPAHLPEI